MLMVTQLSRHFYRLKDNYLPLNQVTIVINVFKFFKCLPKSNNKLQMIQNNFFINITFPFFNFARNYYYRKFTIVNPGGKVAKRNFSKGR